MSEEKGKLKGFRETCSRLGTNNEGLELWATPNGSRFLVDSDGKAVVLCYFPRGFRPLPINSRFTEVA